METRASGLRNDKYDVCMYCSCLRTSFLPCEAREHEVYLTRLNHRSATYRGQDRANRALYDMTFMIQGNTIHVALILNTRIQHNTSSTADNPLLTSLIRGCARNPKEANRDQYTDLRYDEGRGATYGGLNVKRTRERVELAGRGDRSTSTDWSARRYRTRHIA